MSQLLEKTISFYAGLLEQLPVTSIVKLAEGDKMALAIESVRKETKEIVRSVAHAQTFHLAQGVSEMLVDMVSELGEGMYEAMEAVRMPFNDLWIEYDLPNGAQTQAALIVTGEDQTEVSVFTLTRGTFAPASSKATFNHATGGCVHKLTAHHDVSMVQAGPDARIRGELETAAREQQERCLYFINMARALAILLNHKGMFDIEEPKPMGRTERRRFEKEGKPLPAKRVSRIVLGEYGRGQREAMAGGARTGGSKRAHWVRGHFMRTKKGLSWRMPHMRGAGPLIRQERQVTTSDVEANGVDRD